MNYHFSRIVKVPFEQAITSVVEGLKREGFGILTDIDVKAILKNKLGADFRPLGQKQTSRHVRVMSVLPSKQTFASASGTSALCQ